MTQIHIIDVGARDGLHPRWKRIQDRLRVSAFDADTAAPIVGASHYQGALWSHETNLQLNITRSPGCSSVYHPNVEFLKRIPRTERFDVLERRIVHAMPLDSYGLHPHFLKLDTQGSELDILKGAEKTLESVVGVEVEVEFLPMYSGQPLFADVDTFMRERGFELRDLNRFWARDTDSGQLMLWCGEAIYFRRETNEVRREIAQTIHGLYQITARQALAHAYQSVSRYLRSKRPYDSDMQLGI